MNKSKLSAILTLAFVFVSGAVLGVFAYRLYYANPVETRLDPPPSPAKKGPEEFRKWYVPTLTKELKLDNQQVTELNAILDKTRDDIAKFNEKTKPERDELNAKNQAFRERTHPEWEAIHNRQIDAINGMLRPEQQAKYAAFRAERERQRKLHQQQKKQ